MNEKPGKRLVSKEEYLAIQREKGANYASGGCFGLLGVPLLLISLFLFCSCFSSGDFNGVFINTPVVLLLLSLGAFYVCKSYFMSAQEIKPVRPITPHNAGLLPPEKTLVRPSDLPPSHQQAELLRAAQTAQKTAPEELLRATAGAGEKNEC